MAKNAFTGLDDETDTPLRSIMSGAGDALLGDANSRRALLQIGLQMMQPMAMGQSVAGHIGQAIGSGGEAEHRLSEEELKRTKQEDDLDKAQRMLDIRQQEADAYGKGIGLKGLIDRQSLELEKQKGREALLGTKNYAAHAKNIFDTVSGAAWDPSRPENAPFARFQGKDPSAIEDILRAEGEGRRGAAVPTSKGAQDDAARAWALENPTDPRAAKIRQRLGM